MLLPRQFSADLSVPKTYFCVTCTCRCTSGDSRLGGDINSVYFIGTFSSLVPKSSHPKNTKVLELGTSYSVYILLSLDSSCSDSIREKGEQQDQGQAELVSIVALLIGPGKAIAS